MAVPTLQMLIQLTYKGYLKIVGYRTSTLHKQLHPCLQAPKVFSKAVSTSARWVTYLANVHGIRGDNFAVAQVLLGLHEPGVGLLIMHGCCTIV